MNLEENFPNPIGYFTEDHLIDRSATTYEKSTADRWMKKGWPVFNLYNREAFQSIIDERDELKAENEALKQDANYREVQSIRADFNECAAALPGPYYMDPPDGGDVPVAEQLRRMAKDAERYRWLRDKDQLDPRYQHEALTIAFANLTGGALDGAIDSLLQRDQAMSKEG